MGSKENAAKIDAEAAKINLDEHITGGNANPNSGIKPEDLVGGQPVDPNGLKRRLAAARLGLEAEAAEVFEESGNIMGEAGPAGPAGPVVDRVGPASSGQGMIAELPVKEAQARRGPDEAEGAAAEAKQGNGNAEGADVGHNPSVKDPVKAAKAQQKKASARKSVAGSTLRTDSAAGTPPKK